MKNKLYWIGVIVILLSIFLIAIGDGNLGEQVNKKILEAKSFVSASTNVDKSTYTIGETIVFKTTTINNWGSTGWYYKTVVTFDGNSYSYINGYLNPGDTHEHIFNIPTSGKIAGSYGIKAESYIGSAADFEAAWDADTINTLEATESFIITLEEIPPNPIVTINVNVGGCTVVMDGQSHTLGAAETSTTFQVPPSKTYTVTTSKSGYVTKNTNVIVATVDMTAPTISMSTNPVPPVLTFTTANVDEGVLISDGGSNFATTDVSGSVTFTDLGEGSFTFTATKTGYYATPSSYSVTLENDIDESHEFAIYLNPVNIIITTNIPSVSIENSGNIRVTDNVAPYTTTFSSSANAGTLYFSASKAGYDPTQISVNVGTINIERTITLQETVITPDSYIIQFVVNDVNNEPLEGVSITAGGTTEITNVNGETTHSGIGTVSYSAIKTGYYGEFDTLNVVGDTLITLSMLEVGQSVTPISVAGGIGGETTTTISLNEDGEEQFATTNTIPLIILDGEDDKTPPIIIFGGVIGLIIILILARSEFFLKLIK